MAVVFPKKDNPFWPLPAEYAPHEKGDKRATLTKEGQRMARVNACRLGGRSDLEVAAWAFFRETYLLPRGRTWYRTGYTPSPSGHYRWIRDWHSHGLQVYAAPRGTAKTTINLEDLLRHAIAYPNWECALFLATQKFAGNRLGRLMAEVEHNPWIIQDFGKLKPKKGHGIWNRGSCMELTNGSCISAIPITGASLGTRPSGLIVFDDVEKADDLVKCPTDLRDSFRQFFFNTVYPMSRSPGHEIPIRILGTLYNRRMFIYYLATTDDPQITEFWHRTLLTIEDMKWDVMGPEWQELEKRRMSLAAFNAQYLNRPGTEADRILDIHPELCTYYLEEEDSNAYLDPLHSAARVVSHNLTGWSTSGREDSEKNIPIPNRVIRTWGEVVSGMRRFITVDSARTTTKSSDFSVVHVLGFENAEEHRDTLWSLDCWMGKVRYEELVRKIYQMALKWQVTLIGVEAYPVYTEFYEMCQDLLPDLYGKMKEGIMPRIIPLKFPSRFEKADKLMGLEWRFRQFRVKLPLDRRTSNPAYTALWDQVENFTEDLALLEHDDVIDTLAMHQAIGKPHKAAGPDIYKPLDLVESLQKGHHEEFGVPIMSGLNGSDIPPDVLNELLMQRYEDQEGDGEPEGTLGWLDF